MLYRCFTGLLYTVLITFLYTSNVHAISEEDKSNPLTYIELANTHKITNPDAANSALKQAYFLAKEQNNTLLIAKTLLEQAKIAKREKDYFLAQQYLMKAEVITPTLSDDKLSINVLTTMSSIQRSLENYDSSMDYVQKSLAIARESRQPDLIFKCLQMKGALLQKMKRYDDSVTTYLSAQRYMSKAPFKNQVRLLRDTANAYNKVNEYESSIRYYKKALKLIEESNDLSAIPNTLLELAKTQAKIGKYAQALKNTKRSLSLARKYESTTDTVKSLVVLSILYRKLSNYEEALLHGLEALDIHKKNNDLDGFSAAANSIGLIYTHLDQTNNAKNYFSKVVNLPADKINPKYRAAALRDLGKLTFLEDPTSNGLALSNEAFTLYEKIGDRQGIATVQKNIGYIFDKMGNSTESINAYNTAIRMFKSRNDVWNEAESKAHLSVVYVNKDITQAMSLAQSSLTLANRINAKSVAEQAYSALILVEEKRKNYQQALAYFKKKEALINEIKDDVINKRLAEMYIILDVEKKERAYEVLKREKSVITLELDNKANQLNLLEQEKIINDLKNQNTLIILSVTGVIVIICLFFIGRIYFKMQYKFIFTAVIFFALLLYSFNSQSMDIIKLTQGNSTLDVRPKYTLAVLKEALEVSSDKYGPYEIQIINLPLSKNLKIMELHDGKLINLTMAMTSPDWEYLALPIRIPIRRGVANYRLLAINKASKSEFDKVTTLKQLKTFSVGLQKEWVINELLAEEGFNIVEGHGYDGIFRMLNRKRFDFIPRGLHEVYDEVSLRNSDLKNIMVEPTLALYIPHPYYIFVSPKFPKIAERIEYGLEHMIAKGSLQKMFNEHYAKFIKKADLSNRTIINIGNKYLPQKTPLDREELWLMFDL